MPDENVIQNLRFYMSSHIAFGNGKRFISKQELENSLGDNFNQYKPLFEYLDKIDNQNLTEDGQIDMATFANISNVIYIKEQTNDNNISPLGFVKLFENHKDNKKVNEKGFQEVCEKTGTTKTGILNFFNELFKIQMGDDYNQLLKTAQNNNTSNEIGNDTEPVILSTKINDDNTKEIISRTSDNNIQTKIVDMKDKPLLITTVDENNNTIEKKVFKYENDNLIEINKTDKNNVNTKIKYEYLNFNSEAEADEYANKITSEEDISEYDTKETNGTYILTLVREEITK